MKSAVFKKSASIVSVAVFAVLALSACSSEGNPSVTTPGYSSTSEKSPAAPKAPEEVEEKAEIVNNEVDTISIADLGGRSGHLKEVKLHRADGTVATCFIFQGKYTESGAGLDCPEWAQDKTQESINK